MHASRGAGLATAEGRGTQIVAAAEVPLSPMWDEIGATSPLGILCIRADVRSAVGDPLRRRERIAESEASAGDDGRTPGGCGTAF